MRQKYLDKVFHLLKKINGTLVFESEPFCKKDIVCGYYDDPNEPFWIFDNWFDGYVRIFAKNTNKKYVKNKIDEIICIFSSFSDYDVLINDEQARQEKCLYESIDIAALKQMTEKFSYSILVDELKKANCDEIIQYFDKLINQNEE